MEYLILPLVMINCLLAGIFLEENDNPLLIFIWPFVFAFRIGQRIKSKW